MDPPSRNAMWRFGFPNPVDMKDNELWCGGQKGIILFGIVSLPMYKLLNFSIKYYANGLLGRRYTPGQVIDIEVELTSNHKGYFELRLCPLFGYQTANAETENCFDK